LLQYWKFGLDGSAIQGTLDDNYDEGAAAIKHNIVYKDFGSGYGVLTSSSMAEGATMEDTITPTNLQLALEGTSTDLSVHFSINVMATSVGPVTLPGCSTPTTVDPGAP